MGYTGFEYFHIYIDELVWCIGILNKNLRFVEGTSRMDAFDCASVIMCVCAFACTRACV